MPAAIVCSSCSRLTPRDTASKGLCPECVTLDGRRRNRRPASKVYRSRRWRRTRALVLKREHYTCQTCGHEDRTGRTLEAHHLTYDEPFNPSTIVVLCHSCHRSLDARSREAEKVYG